MIARPARETATASILHTGWMRHQLTFRDVPAGLTRCLRCDRLLTASEFVTVPICIPPLR